MSKDSKSTRLRPRKQLSASGVFLRESLEWIGKGTLFLAAASTVAVTLAIVTVLVVETYPFFAKDSSGNSRSWSETSSVVTEFFTSSKWDPKSEQNPHVGILPLVTATVTTTLIALLVAIPLGTIVAVYLSEFAPFTLREILKPLLELLSAVPTVVYGYFALQAVSPALKFFFPDMAANNMLSAGLVMGIMIIPYVSSLSEDAMRSVPMILREGSYALGANKVITAFRVVIPSAISGIAAAYILGVARAVGETMIVAVAAGNAPRLSLNPTDPGQTMTAYIVATTQGEAGHGTLAYQSLFPPGLALFAMTLLLNILGYYMRKRYHQAAS